MICRRRHALVLPAVLAWGLLACGDEGVDIDTSGYEVTCKVASDCIMAPTRDVCGPCAGGELSVFARAARERYEADVAAANCADAVADRSGDGCAPPPAVRPACEAGRCATEPASCGDGLCDHYEWDPRETATSCPDDCRCGDGVCDLTERTGTGACAKDCPTTGTGR